MLCQHEPFKKSARAPRSKKSFQFDVRFRCDDGMTHSSSLSSEWDTSRPRAVRLGDEIQSRVFISSIREYRKTNEIRLQFCEQFVKRQSSFFKLKDPRSQPQSMLARGIGQKACESARLNLYPINLMINLMVGSLTDQNRVLEALSSLRARTQLTAREKIRGDWAWTASISRFRPIL